MDLHYIEWVAYYKGLVVGTGYYQFTQENIKAFNEANLVTSVMTFEMRENLITNLRTTYPQLPPSTMFSFPTILFN